MLIAYHGINDWRRPLLKHYNCLYFLKIYLGILKWFVDQIFQYIITLHILRILVISLTSLLLYLLNRLLLFSLFESFSSKENFSADGCKRWFLYLFLAQLSMPKLPQGERVILCQTGLANTHGNTTQSEIRTNTSIYKNQTKTTREAWSISID